MLTRNKLDSFKKTNKLNNKNFNYIFFPINVLKTIFENIYFLKTLLLKTIFNLTHLKLY